MTVISDISGSPPSALRQLLPGFGMSAMRAFAGPLIEPPRDDQLFCPDAIRDDPALGDLVDDMLIDWAGDVGIYDGKLDKLRSYGFGRYMMLAHPAVSDPDRLLMATKCLVAEWAADDYYVDEVELGADPAVVGSRMARLLSIVDPARMVPRYATDMAGYHRLEPISEAFRTAIEHLARYATTA
jgi:2-methylisoborneol synthase